NTIENRTLSFGAGANVHVLRDNQLIVTADIRGSDIDGAGPLVKDGAGALTLSGNCSYRGATEVREGTLLVGSENGLGFGTLKLIGGTLQSSLQVPHGLTLANPVDAATFSSNISGSNGINFTGTVQILPFARLTVANTANTEGYVSFLGTIYGSGS